MAQSVTLCSLPLPLGSCVLFQPAAIHHDQQPGIQSALSGGVIDDAFLQPDGFRANRDRLIDCGAGFFRSTEYVDEIDLFCYV